LRMNFWNRLSVVTLMSVVGTTLHAQIPEKVGSLLQADKDAAALAKASTPHQAFLSIIDKESTFYVPSAVNAYNYLNNRPNIPDVLHWQPTFALIAKSQEFGVTSGSMDFQKVGARLRHGEYLTVWKRNKKGKWLVDIRAEVENNGNDGEFDLEYIEPTDSWYLKHRSKVRLNQREDIVLETDKLMSTVLKADNPTAYKEFLSEDVRFLFPWTSPMEGKATMMAYLKKQRMTIETVPEEVKRSYSGDFAYTKGTATVRQKDKVVKYNYIRIWQLSELAKDDVKKANWNILIEMMFEK